MKSTRQPMRRQEAGAAATPHSEAARDPRISITVKPQAGASHPLGQRLVSLWTEARDAGQPLSRKDIPSRPLVRLMPHLFLLEPSGSGTDWRFRLFGTAIAARFGGDVTGRLISETYDASQAKDQASIYLSIVERGTPHITHGHIAGTDKGFLRSEFCHLPVVPPSQGLPWLLGGVFVFELG